MRSYLFLFLFFPLVLTSCGKDNDSGGSSSSSSSSSSAGTMSSNGITVTSSQYNYGSLLVTIACTSSSKTVQNHIDTMNSYISSLQSKTYLTYNGAQYSTQGHLEAAYSALNALQTYKQYYGNVSSSNYCPTTISQGQASQYYGY